MPDTHLTRSYTVGPLWRLGGTLLVLFFAAAGVLSLAQGEVLWGLALVAAGTGSGVQVLRLWWVRIQVSAQGIRLRALRPSSCRAVRWEDIERATFVFDFDGANHTSELFLDVRDGSAFEVTGAVSFNRRDVEELVGILRQRGIDVRDGSPEAGPQSAAHP